MPATLAFLAGLVVGCSAPPAIPGADLPLADGASGKKRAPGSTTADSSPEGEQTSTELGTGTAAGAPAASPEPQRQPGDDGTSNGAPSQCATDAECNQTGRICTAGACVKGCRDDVGCSPSQVCSAGQCALTSTSAQCVADYDCDYGTICIASQCTPGCYTSVDCPTGQTCASGMCTATTTTATPPPAGGVACASDGQCNPGVNGSGQICSAQGSCVPGCHRDNQCPGVAICSNGTCR